MKRIIMVLILGLLAVNTVRGFDGKRKGFIAGGGLGLGAITYKEKVTGPLGPIQSDRTSELAFMTDFKIGYAFTNQLELFYSDKGAWFDYFGKIGLNGLGTAAVNYYLKPEGPTFYLGGGLGFSTFLLPFTANSDVDLGFGFYAGAGYEFVKHFAVELNFMFGTPQEKSGGFENKFIGFSPRITIIGTAF